jgi:molybdopterin/thiamine biosynthesis adenylyltransferase
MTNLADRAYTVDYLGTSQRVVEDGPLLAWAQENHLSLAAAQGEALQQGVLPLRYARNFSALSLLEQQRLCSSTVLVCGCGGLGGIVIQLLARAGVGRLRVVDGDIFVPSNLNRQLLCDTQHLAEPKAQVAARTVRAVNPLVEVEATLEPLDEGNAGELIAGADLALDALDSIPARFVLADAARGLRVPLIHAAVAGWWGQLSTLLPDSRCDLTSIYGERRMRDASEQALGVLGPMAAIIGSLEALEAIRVLSGRPSAYSNRLLYFDGETGRMEIVPLD